MTTQRRAGRTAVLVAMTVANAMVLVDQTAVPMILPDVIQQFDIGSQSAQWMISASLLTLASLLIFGGRLSDVLGRRRTFVIGSVVFAGASACAGLAPTYPLLLVFRVIQGAAGALMLRTTIAIVSSTFPGPERGRALGTMGGAAAIAGAFGPVIGGALTSAFGWRSVLLINVPLALVAVGVALRSVPADRPERGGRIDLLGTALLSLGLIGLILGLTQAPTWGWTSPGVWLPLALSAVAISAFVLLERRKANPLLDFSLLRRFPNYRGATISQGLAGVVEMGLGVLLPLLLILNLGMDPGLAGLALIPTTLPMILMAPLAGRWYDRAGGRQPLTSGFLLIALAGVTIAITVHGNTYWLVFPGLLVLGIGIAVVLTVNDPVTLDTLPEASHGEASGVSATAEQFGGAVGISALFIAFHTVYTDKLYANVDASPLTDLTPEQYQRLEQELIDAEQVGLHPDQFDPAFQAYLAITRDAANWGFTAAFVTVAVLALIGAVLCWRFVRPPSSEADDSAPEREADA